MTLRSDSRIPRRETFRFAGCDWVLETDSDAVADSVRRALPATPGPPQAEFLLKLNLGRGDSPCWPTPLFRGRDHIVVAAYGPDDVMVFDLDERSVTGTVSASVAADAEIWKRLLIPVIIGVASASAGIAPLHCATLVRNGRGLHISGVSGAGKSTLTAALASRGFSVLADDWTYFSAGGGSLMAHGLPVPLKLLADASNFFLQLAGRAPAPSLNGELAYELDPALFGCTRVHSCIPERLVFLRRTPGAAWSVSRVAEEEVARQFQPALERLPEFLQAERRQQFELIRLFARLPAHVVSCSGAPFEIADRMTEWLHSGCATTQAEVCGRLPAQFEVEDLMRRFVPVPCSIEASVPGGVCRIHTNVAAITDAPDLLRETLPPDLYLHDWTVVEDAASWPEMNWRNDRFTVAARRDLGLRLSDHARKRSFVYLAPSGAARLSLLVSTPG